MAIIGISLLVASVVLFCLRPPAWLPSWLAYRSQRSISRPAPRPPIEQPQGEHEEEDGDEEEEEEEEEEESSAREAEGPDLDPNIQPEKEEKGATIWEQPPSIIIQEPAPVDTQVRGTWERDVDSALTRDKDRRDEDTRDEEMLNKDEDEDEDEHEHEHEVEDEDVDEEVDEQKTPKATATTRDDPIPSLVLPASSTPAKPSEDSAPLPPPPVPYFAMTPPPPVFHIEPASERIVENAPQQMPPPQLNLVAPEQPSTPTAPPPPSQRIPVPTPPTKSPSDMMPPPPLPRPKVSKPRTSGIPLPAASSSSPTVRRMPSLTNARPSSPTPSRIPSPTATTNRIPSPTTATSNTARSSMAPPANRIPTLNGLPRRSSPNTSPSNAARTLPLPRRGGTALSSSSSGLMPPPTATGIPKKPSRQVSLQPGHSPLDWARLAQTPTSDLRNLPPETPYLRVTPRMLAQHNGRKGRDAWSVFGGGRVYNISPYIPFHPGGGPELLRAAGKDGTRLFAEVHPWVNYETMLQSCLIGLLVEEGEADKSAMDEMD